MKANVVNTIRLPVSGRRPIQRTDNSVEIFHIMFLTTDFTIRRKTITDFVKLF